jgi:hypothetical protein
MAKWKTEEYLLSWAAALALDVASSVSAEKWVRLNQLVGLVCVPGAMIAVLNVRADRDGVWRNLRNLLAALALVFLVWFSFAFHLISFHIN